MSTNYYKRFRMELDLRGQHFYPLRSPGGYRLVPWRPELLEDHIEAKYHSFAGELDAEVFPCLGEMDGCRRLMDEISHKEGFLPQATWLVEYIGAGPHRIEPCGTIQGIRANRHTGGIQNVGITPFHRGHGVGSCLIGAALYGFQQAGLKQVCLEVTAKNVRAIKLYRRMGFRQTKTVYKAVELAYS